MSIMIKFMRYFLVQNSLKILIKRIKNKDIIILPGNSSIRVYHDNKHVLYVQDLIL